MIAALFGFVAGLLFGSFLNVCVYRWPRGGSVREPRRSFCPGCGRTLAWYHNIPLASFLALRGRCHFCAARISLRYPLVELAVACLFAFCGYRSGFTVAAAADALFGWLLIGLAVTDFEHKLLPDVLTLGGLAAGLGLSMLRPLTPLLPYPGPADSLLESLFGAAGPSFLIWSIGELFFLIRHREGLGLGDVKMLAMIGAFSGLAGALLALAVASTLGSIVGVIYIRMAGKSAATFEIPFGVFLAAGGMGVLLFTPGVIPV